MRMSRRLALLGMAVVLLYLGTEAGAFSRAEAVLRERLEEGRMRNVTVTAADDAVPASRPIAAAAPSPEPAVPPSPEAQSLQLPAAERQVLRQVLESVPDEEIRETTIPGGMRIKNETHYQVDVSQLLREGPELRLPAEGPQILIIHTHGSEAYTPSGLDRYEANDSSRTADTQYNIIRVGDELADKLSAAGLRVLHDREIYDYPSYTGSYTRSGQAVEAYLREYPDIAVVLDVHRDALGSDGVVYKTMAEEDGTVASQIMLLAGSDESGLEHPNWRSNLALALYLQEAVGRRHPSLMRPVALVPQRYNQNLTPGSLILEVGSSGNTLQEALAAIRLFADAAAPALLALADRAE